MNHGYSNAMGEGLGVNQFSQAPASAENYRMTTAEPLTASATAMPSMLLGPSGKKPLSRKSKSAQQKQHRRYVCKGLECKKVFSRPYDLQRHERTHTDSKPHECNTCGTFA